MSAPIPRLEAGALRVFTATFSTAPASGASLAFFSGSGASILVDCVTAAASSSTEFYRYYTLPNSPGALLSYQWDAYFSASSGGHVLPRGMIHLIHTRP